MMTEVIVALIGVVPPLLAVLVQLRRLRRENTAQHETGAGLAREAIDGIAGLRAWALDHEREHGALAREIAELRDSLSDARS